MGEWNCKIYPPLKLVIGSLALAGLLCFGAFALQSEQALIPAGAAGRNQRLF
jgi:hypothetical protein